MIKKNKKNNKKYQIMKKILEKGIIQFSIVSKLKILISKYSINKNNKMNFRKKKQVFQLKFLKTKIIY